MGKIAWYKRYPSAALGGMFDLTLEERGAYNTVLDLIYEKGDELPDDDRFIAGWCRCDVRVWRRIKERLIGLEKLVVEDGFLRNIRATSEVDRAIHRGISSRNAGLTSAAKSRAKSNENNDLASTAVPTTVPTIYKKTRIRELSLPLVEIEERKPPLCSPLSPGEAGTEPPPKQRRSTRLASDWKLPEEWAQWAWREMGWQQTEIVEEAAIFRDYWTARSGAQAAKLDWEATWRNWCRRSSRPRGGAKAAFRMPL